MTTPPEQAVAIVTAGDVPLGSEENILCITGGEGTGKSNYTAALVAGAIMERETDADLLGVRVEPNRKGRAVLLYDTEQSEQQLHKNTGRLLRRAGRERMPEYLHVYCLTGMSRSERLTAIVQSMDRYHYLHGGIHLVVIDGVADLIRCANDEAESVALIDEIYRLAGIYRTCIAAVVHFVPNGLKLRGHLGSELQRKSAAILSIEKDENPEVSVVKALKVRDGSPLDIPLMQFRWDKQAGDARLCGREAEGGEREAQGKGAGGDGTGGVRPAGEVRLHRTVRADTGDAGSEGTDGERLHPLYAGKGNHRKGGRLLCTRTGKSLRAGWSASWNASTGRRNCWKGC